jgi:putative polyketide hydroxylase
MALLLAREGVPCALFERKERVSTHPKAMGLTRRTGEIFRQLGIEKALADASLPLASRELAFWGRSLVGEEFGRVSFLELESPHSPCPPRHCPQTYTENILIEALRAEPLASLHFGTLVTEVHPSGDGVALVLENGSTVRAGWLVVAEGAGGRIREALGIETDGPGDLGHFINTLFRAPYGPRLSGREAVLYHALDTECFEMFVAVNGDDLWLMHHFLQPTEQAADYSFERLAGIIRHASGMPDVPVEVLGVRPWVMSPRVARRWREGSILLCGDAAARLSPAGGLGLNNGLQSCHNLAWKLAAVVRGEAEHALLDTYETERLEYARRLMRSTNRNAEEVFSVVSAAVAGDFDRVRDIVAHSRRHASGLGLDLGAAYESGAFLPDGTEHPLIHDPVNDYVPSARPGSRAPHAAVTHAEAASLLDLFGRGFVALAGRDGCPWRQHCTRAKVFQNLRDFHCDAFESLYGIGSSGVALVRPDGYIAARFPAKPDADTPNLDRVIAAILSGKHSLSYE